jgi:hypothetical protein
MPSGGRVDFDIAAWRHTYYQTELGIGFAGYCFEAMTIIALFIRAMEQLVSEADEPRPEPNAIANVLAAVIRGYFADHANPITQRVHFLLFGFTAERPWIAQVGYTPAGLVGPIVNDLVPNRVHAIGDAGDKAFTETTEETLA